MTICLDRGRRSVQKWVITIVIATTTATLDPLSATSRTCAEESSVVTEPPEGTKADSEKSPEADGGPGAGRIRRGPLAPRILSPEEREETERLKALAARFGTDPTAIVGRMQISSQYADLPGQARFSDSVVRIDVPFRGNWIVRMDLPFIRWTDPNRPGTTSAAGLSDLAFTAGWRVLNTTESALFLGVVSTYPTATNNGLGFGKYTAGPILATSRFLPQWESFLFVVFQHLLSVGGDPSRRGIQFTQGSAQINTIWAERWWTTVQGVWRVDWEGSAKTSMTAELEVGRNVIGPFGMFVRPGVGVWGQSGFGAYTWNIEAGVRYMFRSF